MAEFWAVVIAFYAGPFGVPARVLTIIVVASLVRLVLQLVIRRVVNRVISGVKKKQNVEDTAALQASPVAAMRIVQRTRAFGGVLSSTVTTVVILVSLVLIVSAIDPNATGAFSLITAALGAGLGFGAQNVVRDVLNGLFIVTEDQLGVGDVVDLGQATGVVEAVGIRVTTVRDVNGTLWYVRNGEILRVGNMSQGWARVILDLAIPYDADIDAVKERMLQTGVEMRADGKWKRLMIEQPEIWGIESISAEAIILRLVVKTRSGAKDDVARELRARVKRTLDGMGIRVPALGVATAGVAHAGGANDTPVIPGVVKQSSPRPPAAGGKK
ncbi:mechanosensitive ion channel domain-containing protein [Pseudolysinimonas sp.]|uniref:mechanosensitive ion channel family protein n=1 Tax=Pseudolysinimonas sp. TaxID=2680009 RepID=UPI00286B73E3|nr:mechanosensitive ion channel domain-containing protein [Pseudolysinimonas sp.]